MTDNDTKALISKVVAIGASAGGLTALQAALPKFPVGEGVAYVLAQHMDPKHPSLLDRILQRETKLTVTIAAHREVLKADWLYIIPPNQNGMIAQSEIQLEAMADKIGVRHTVDVLFRSVARAFGARCVGVVLSGSGNDGLQGVRAIKAAEGVVIAQDFESATYTGMPSAIIQENLADVIAPPKHIGEALHHILQWPEKPVTPIDADADIDNFRELIRLIIRKTGVALDQYKDTTLRRRIERRRVVTRQENLLDYRQFVESSDTEADLLLQDILISVTDFFRDSVTFLVIADTLKSLVLKKNTGDSIRIWVAGCATGEEAFSIAMLLAEELHKAQKILNVQIFATDIDAQAIDVARKSTYLKATIEELPATIRDNYFTATDGSCHISDSVRNMVTFARHDLLQDPPFNRLDMVSCRNVMIYFKRPVQERLIAMFHYSLNVGGYLVLGPSEGIANSDELFKIVSPPTKLFVRCNAPSSLAAVNAPKMLPLRISNRKDNPSGTVDTKQNIRDLVLDNYAPPCILLDHRSNVVRTHGDISHYVGLPEGDISINIHDMVAAPLRLELRLVLQKCNRERRLVRSHPIKFKLDDERVTLTLIAIPSVDANADSRQSLVLFESKPPAVQSDEFTPDQNSALRIRELDQELTATRDQLQSNIEQLESSNEELQSVNEEYQSTTEELQSANEELQTTNEEIQSTNEELSTVNEELSVRSDDLINTNRDLESILNSSVSGLVVLDNELRVTRYSAASQEIFNLLPTSIGKPLVSVGGAVDLAVLGKEIKRALDTNSIVERELDLGDRMYITRFIPQRKDENSSAGLLISFVDASESLLAARQSRRLATVLKDSSDAITVQTHDGRILAWNKGAEHMYGYSESEALTLNISVLVPRTGRDQWQAIIEGLSTEHPHLTTEIIRQDKYGKDIEVSVAVTALFDGSDEAPDIATTERDLTPFRNAESEKRQAQFAHEARLTTAGEMAAGLAHELNQPITSIVHFCDVGLAIAHKFNPERRQELIEVLTDATQQSQRAGEIISNLRRFLGRRESVRLPQEINSVVREGAGFVKLECKRNDVELEFNFSDNLPPVIMDKTLIGQVLVNLIRNSVEAMVDSNSQPRKMTLRTALDDNLVKSVHVSVADTGPGISNDMAERLFDPFHTNKSNGLGIGLWMSRSIVESHGGRLWSEQLDTGGAIFHFSLPAATE